MEFPTNSTYGHGACFPSCPLSVVLFVLRTLTTSHTEIHTAMDRISSTLLPKVTLSSAPMAVPKRRARSSVTSPSISASGTSASRFCGYI